MNEVSPLSTLPPEMPPIVANAATDTRSSKTPHFPTLSRRLVSALSTAGIGSIVTLAISTLASIAIARNGGPEGYAAFISANMIVFISAVLCSCGLPIALAKHIAAEEEQKRHEAVRRACTTALGLLFMVAGVWGACIGFYVPRLESYVGVSAGRGFAVAFPLVLICAVMSDCIQVIYYGLLRPRAAIVIAASGPLAMLVYVLMRRTVLVPYLPLWGAVAASYICSGLAAGAFVWRDRLLSAFTGLADLRPVLKDIAPAAAFTFFTVFSSWSDRWIVGTQLGAAAMGSYAAAAVVIQAALRVPTSVSWILVPASARVGAGGTEKSVSFNYAVIDAFALFAALTTVTLMLAPSFIIQSLFGQGFRLGAPVLLIMTPSLLASAISVSFISTLTGSAKNKLVTYLLVLTLIPRLILLMFFTRRWSVVGTAFATILAESLLALCCILLARKTGISIPLGALVKRYATGALAYAAGLGALLLGAPQVGAVFIALAVFMPGLWRQVRRMNSAPVRQ